VTFGTGVNRNRFKRVDHGLGGALRSRTETEPFFNGGNEPVLGPNGALKQRTGGRTRQKGNGRTWDANLGTPGTGVTFNRTRERNTCEISLI